MLATHTMLKIVIIQIHVNIQWVRIKINIFLNYEKCYTRY